MIETKNENTTMTFEEFLNKVKELVPTAGETSLKAAYEQMRKNYIIPENGVRLATEKSSIPVLKFIEPEYHHLYKVLNVDLDYDCDETDLHPQDCPYEILLINITNGYVITCTQILQHLRG